jgi:DNA-binding transcriptional LysR family regulator
MRLAFWLSPFASSRSAWPLKGSGLMAPALADWKRQLPGVHFEVVEADQELLLRSLKAGELDTAIIEFDAGEPAKSLPSGVTEIPLIDEPWKLVVPAGTLLTETTDLGRLKLPWLGVGYGDASAQPLLRLRRVAESTNRPFTVTLRHKPRWPSSR